MAQTLLPISQISNSNWLGESSETTNLHLKIDESGSPNDADYIQTTGVNGAVIKFGLTSVTDPASSSGHILRTRYQFSSGTQTFNLTMNLRDGGGAGTLRATKTIVVDIGTVGWVDHVWTLSGAEADAIVDYTTLKLEFSSASPDSDEIPFISRSYFEVPDAPTGQPAVRRTSRMEVGRVGVRVA